MTLVAKMFGKPIAELTKEEENAYRRECVKRSRARRPKKTRKTRFSQRTRCLAVRLYSEGLSPIEISKRTGASRKRITDWANEDGFIRDRTTAIKTHFSNKRAALLASGYKKCNRCGLELPLNAFHLYTRKSGLYRSACRHCLKRYRRLPNIVAARARFAAKRYNQQKRDAYIMSTPQAKRLALARRRTYGITAEQFDRLFEKQGKRCAICGTEQSTRNWALDHDHTTGKVRGILCQHCNSGIGLLKDDPKRMFAAARYLKFPPAADMGFVHKSKRTQRTNCEKYSVESALPSFSTLTSSHPGGVEVGMKSA